MARVLAWSVGRWWCLGHSSPCLWDLPVGKSLEGVVAHARPCVAYFAVVVLVRAVVGSAASSWACSEVEVFAVLLHGRRQLLCEIGHGAFDGSPIVVVAGWSGTSASFAFGLRGFRFGLALGFSF